MDPQQPRTVQKCAHVTPETTMEAERTPRGPADPAPRRFDSTTRRPPDTQPTTKNNQKIINRASLLRQKVDLFWVQVSKHFGQDVGRIFGLISLWFSIIFLYRKTFHSFINFLSSFAWISVPMILKNEHLVYTRRSFSENHLLPSMPELWCKIFTTMIEKCLQVEL